MSTPIRSVTIDSLPTSAFRHLDDDAIVCVDVLLTTTTLVTAVAQGREAYTVTSIGDAHALAGRLGDALLAGDPQAAVSAAGLEMADSPTALLARGDLVRPLVLVSASGGQLIANAAPCAAVYALSLRNLAATAAHLARHHRRVAILGAGDSGQPRCEDQMAAARLARRLVGAGFRPSGNGTAESIERWADVDLGLVRLGSSAEHLRRVGRDHDVEFVVRHHDDVDVVCRLSAAEAVAGHAAAEPSLRPMLRAV